MPLETLRRGAPANVRDLTIEEPSTPTGAKFDVERDIPLGVKRKLLNAARLYLAQDIIDLSFISDVKSLYPRDLADARLTDDQVKAYLDRYPLSRLDAVHQVKPLNERYKISVARSTLDEEAEKIRLFVEDGVWKRFSGEFFKSPILTVKMLAPEKLADLTPNPQFVSRLNVFFSPEGSHSYLRGGLSDLRILFWPQEPPIKPTEENWKGLFAALKHYCDIATERIDGDLLSTLVELARKMQILAADDLEINQNGIQLIFNNSSFSNTQQPMPESRRF